MSSSSSAKAQEVFSLKIFKYQRDNCVEIADYENLSGRFSFFQRPTVREFLRFNARTVANRTEMGKRQSIELTFEGQKLGMCHTWVHPAGLAATVITEPNYNLRVAYTMISDTLQAFARAYPNGDWQGAVKDTNMKFGEGESELTFI